MLAALLIEDRLESSSNMGEIRNFRMHNQATLPTDLPDSARGHFRYRTSDDKAMVWKGTTLGWVELGGGASTSYVDAGDAATYANAQAYANAIAQGLDPKASVIVATTTALPTNALVSNSLTATTVGALPAIDGVTLTEGQALLVKNESAGEKNGIYEVSDVGDGSTPWVLTRRGDADDNSKVTSGMYCWATQGTTNGDTAWVLTTNDPLDLNTTPLTFSMFSGGDKVSKAGDSAIGRLRVSNPTPINTDELTSKAYVDDSVAAATDLANAAYTIASAAVEKAGGSGGIMTGNLTVPNIIFGQTTITYASTITFDFDGPLFQKVSLTGNLTLTANHMAAGKMITIELAADSSARTLTYDTDWKGFGTAITSVAANKRVKITLEATGTAATDVHMVAVAQT